MFLRSFDEGAINGSTSEIRRVNMATFTIGYVASEFMQCNTMHCNGSWLILITLRMSFKFKVLIVSIGFNGLIFDINSYTDIPYWVSNTIQS